jgi:hypothetical protein
MAQSSFQKHDAGEDATSVLASPYIRGYGASGVELRQTSAEQLNEILFVVIIAQSKPVRNLNSEICRLNF